MPGARHPPPPPETARWPGGAGRDGRIAHGDTSVHPRSASLRSVPGWAVVVVVIVMAMPGLAVAGPVERSNLPGTTAPSTGHPLAPLSAGVLPNAPSAPSSKVPPPTAANCSTIDAGWGLLYGSGPAPPAVWGTSQPGCVPGPDEEGVTIASNSTASASQFEVTVSLPSSASSAPSSFDEFWLSLTVRGVSCSLDGQSVLRIDLAPPGSTLGGAGGWAVQAPVWGLNPAGACDPRCQNTTAYYDLGGNGFCLDNTLLKGAGFFGGSEPIFTPGDTLRFTVTNGSGRGLTIYANDTDHPVLSTSWSYPSGSLVDGASVEPFGAVARPTSGWTFGGSVGFGWTNCPWINASGAPSCDSYDAPIDSALSFPTVTGSLFWNASVSLYDNSFTSYDPWSSTGGCQGSANLSACLDFSSNGGTGAYPGIHVSAGGGNAWVSYGANSSSTIGSLGRSNPEFAADGTSAPNDPAIVGELSALVNNSAIELSARATDPRGIEDVEFSALWCFTGGSGPSPVPLSYSGTPSAGVANGTQDSYWTALFPGGTTSREGPSTTRPSSSTPPPTRERSPSTGAHRSPRLASRAAARARRSRSRFGRSRSPMGTASVVLTARAATVHQELLPGGDSGERALRDRPVPVTPHARSFSLARSAARHRRQLYDSTSERPRSMGGPGRRTLRASSGAPRSTAQRDARRECALPHPTG